MKNVKNIILGMVFLFGMSVSVDAKTMVKEDPVSECIAQSFRDYDFILGFTGNADWAFQVSEELLSGCLTGAGIN
ncbi:MAG: hypothetical protein QM478_00750 [Flavobacteriaceae bacterium]